MNCPSCNSPLFVAESPCNCGYKPSEIAVGESFELSYVEALLAFWCVYWPSQLVVFALNTLTTATLVAVLGQPRAFEFLRSPAFVAPLQLLWSAIGLLLFVHRPVWHEFRRFSILVVTDTIENASRKVTLSRRIQLCYFLWWRQAAAGVALWFLSAPLNILLSLMRIYLSTQLASIAGLVIVGPVLMKMMIGHQFSDFHLSVYRTPPLEFAADSESA